MSTATCAHFTTGGGYCRAPAVNRYQIGWRCPAHTPNALRGLPETVPDPTRTAAALRAQHQAEVAAVRAVRDRVLNGVADSQPQHLTTALDVIRRHAATARGPISANTARQRMERAGVPGPVRGVAFRRAVELGLLVQVGAVTSTDRGTHAKPVAEYRPAWAVAS